MLCRSAAQQEHYGKKAAAKHGLQFYKHHCRKVSHAADWQRGLRAHKHCPPCGPPKGRPLALRAPGCQEGILSKAVTGKATRSQRHEMPRRGLHLLKAALSRSRISNTPLHDRDVLVTACGRICIYRKKSNVSTVLAGHGSASRRSTRELGSSASSTMIWDISIWSREPCNPSTTRSGPGCHPCLRDIL